MRRIFAFEDGAVRQYEGGFTDYQARRQQEAEDSADVPAGRNPAKAEEKAGVRLKSVKNRQDRLKFSYKEQKEYESIEDEITALEEKIEKLETDMAEHASDFVKLNALAKDKEAAEQLLEEKMDRWMYLQELAEKIAGQDK